MQTNLTSLHRTTHCEYEIDAVLGIGSRHNKCLLKGNLSFFPGAKLCIVWQSDIRCVAAGKSSRHRDTASKSVKSTIDGRVNRNRFNRWTKIELQMKYWICWLTKLLLRYMKKSKGNVKVLVD